MKLSFKERKEIIEDLINNEYIQKHPTSTLTRKVVITKSKYYVDDSELRHSIMKNLIGKKGFIEISSIIFKTLPDVYGYTIVDVQYYRFMKDYNRCLDDSYSCLPDIILKQLNYQLKFLILMFRSLIKLQIVIIAGSGMELLNNVNVLQRINGMLAR